MGREALDPGASWQDYLHARDWRPPASTAAESPDEAEELFGIGGGELQALNDHDLHILYKKKAMALHPDHGGDQEWFVRLTKVYEEMMRMRGHGQGK